MEICFEGIGQAVATFQTEDELGAGQAVAIKGSGLVGLGEANDLPCGVTVGPARDGAVAVQIGGAVKAPYSGGAAPAPGWAALACDGKGALTAAEGGGLTCLVLAVDETEKTVTVRL